MLIEVHNISKSYGSVQALKELSFKVEEGQLYGLIGPDGAGKTTLFRILTTLLLADSGEATMDGLDVKKNYKKIRKMVGYMPERFSLYMDLTVEENLNFFATVFQTTVEENYHLIHDIYQMLEPFKKRKAGDLSGGMKQKLALSCALIHKPRILLLDEPTTGVDPVSRKEFWEMLKKLQQSGLTTLVSTPFLDEAELCDEVALVQNGQILKVDSPHNIAMAYPHRLWQVKSGANYKTLKILKEFDHKISAFAFGNVVHLATNSEVSEEMIEVHLKQNGVEHIQIKPIQAGIEDVFMDLMQ
ncbi:MAG: ABC transporter ATP-binding protein [Crocinitomicaceae bacterium]|nr:ABC transporter ATP-binding protein [Crocinitomicaceae bacterium]